MRKRPATLSGKVLNCAIWIPNEYGGWKCGMYGRNCKGDTCAPLPNPQVKQVKVCTTTQRVFSPFLDKDVTRCKTYAPTCSGKSCMDFTMPYPKEASEKTMPSPSEIRTIAEWMAAEYNEETFKKEPYLARQILERGGIAPPRGKSAESEEYKSIPLFLRNKRGLPCDEMASEMKYDYCDDLRADIAKQYPPKTKGAWKKKQRKERSDFIDAAYEYIEDQMGEGEWQ
jgi:hypothetical protein